MADPRRERLAEPFPMIRVVDRVPGPAWDGPVFVWDIDQTYLDTRLAHWLSMAAIPFEFGIDKRPVPGSVELLRALRDGAGREHRPLYFVSASPPEISRAIERRMLMDGVEWDGIFYKDALRLLRAGRPRQLRHHVAYKLSALVLLLGDTGPRARLHLFGDDVEKDALVYALAADVAAGRLRGRMLESVLAAAGVEPGDASRLSREAEALEPREAVAGIHIRLARAPDGARIAAFPAKVLGHPTFASAARWLAGQGVVSAAAAGAVEAVAGASSPVPGRAADDGGFVVPAELRAAAERAG